MLGGTSEARELIRHLAHAGFHVLASATTDYGGKLLKKAGAGVVSVGAMDVSAMKWFIEENGVGMVVDATHPFATEARSNARAAAAASGTAYIRLEREAGDIPEHPLIRRVASYEEAARLAVTLGEVIFLTTGSKTLGIFVNVAAAWGRRVVARVLPQPDIVDRCLALGLAPRDVVAMQGPFSRELNRAMFQEYGAEVIVTKESGPTGGLREKVLAALDLGLTVVMIERPGMAPAGHGMDNQGGLRCVVARRTEEVVRLVIENSGRGGGSWQPPRAGDQA